MRLIYPVKIVQTVVVLVCVYVLLRGRDFCSERSQKQFEEEIRTVLSNGQEDQPCTITVIQLPDFYRIDLTDGNATRLLRKRSYEVPKVLPTDDDWFQLKGRYPSRRSPEAKWKEQITTTDDNLGEKEKVDLTAMESVESTTVAVQEESKKEETVKPNELKETTTTIQKKETVESKETVVTLTVPAKEDPKTAKLNELKETTTIQKEDPSTDTMSVEEDPKKEETVKSIEASVFPEETVKSTETVKGESREETVKTTASTKKEILKTNETLPMPAKKESKKEETVKPTETIPVPTKEVEIKKEELLEEESGQEAVTTTNQLIPVETNKNTELIVEEDEKKEEKEVSKWTKLFERRGSNWYKTCMSVSFGLTVDWNLLPLSPIWLTVLFFLLNAMLLQLELFYSSYSKKEQSRKGVWLTGSLHVLLMTGAVCSLLYFRLNWTHIWPKAHLVETPIYPTGWFDTELAALLLVVCHILEMIFYRVIRGRVVFSNQMDSYNVAQKESEMRTYVSAFEEPLDGSYEL